MLDRDMRRALRFVVPYWRRLALVVLISIDEHRADALSASPVARLLRSRAGRPRRAVSASHRRRLRRRNRAQLRAECRQRAALHARLGRHPVRHAAGDVSPPAADVAALLRAPADGRHHVAHQQRHQRNSARGRRDGARVGRERPVPRRHDRDAGVARPAAVPADGGHGAARGGRPRGLPEETGRRRSRCCASAAPISAASSSRRCRR